MKYLLFVLAIISLRPMAPTCDEQKMKQLAHSATTIVVAEILDVKPAIGFWSGYFVALQQVQSNVKEVLKGELTPREIEVGHYVVKNSRTADIDRPRLSPKLFVKGNQLVLFLIPKQQKVSPSGTDVKSAGETYIVPDENCGALPANDETVKLIQQILSRSTNN
jgi:hypothetical protein